LSFGKQSFKLIKKLTALHISNSSYLPLDHLHMEPFEMK